MINLSDYDVIYNERIYKALDMQIEFDCIPGSEPDKAVHMPKYLDITCINEDGNVITIHDENTKFRFVRKERKA